MRIRPHPFEWTAMRSGPDLLPERMQFMLTLVQPGHQLSHPMLQGLNLCQSWLGHSCPMIHPARECSHLSTGALLAVLK